MVATEHQFMGHITEFGLSYGTRAEYEFREALYWKMDAKIQKINQEQSSYTVGHKKLSTWTAEEYDNLMGDNAGNQTARFV